MGNTNLKVFRIIAILEGISFLALLMVGMPLKYYFDSPATNKVLGMGHGILFILYIIWAFMVKTDKDWPIKTTVIVLVASLIPAGTFYIDHKYLRN